MQNLFSSSFISEDLTIEIYRTIILRVVLYGCDTWLLTLRKEYRLRMSENRVLRKRIGSKRDQVTGKWRKVRNEELNSPYSSPNIIRVIKSRRTKLAGHVARVGERRGTYRILLGKPERKSPLERPRLRWKCNIKMNLQEEGCGDMHWIDLDQDRDRCWALVNPVVNLRFPKNAVHFLTS